VRSKYLISTYILTAVGGQGLSCVRHADLPGSGSVFEGFHLTIEMWRGGRNVDGWKLSKTGDDASVCSASSLRSLDVTRAGGRGLNLDFASTIMAGQVEDEDTAAANHRMCGKIGKEHVYAPADGITFPVPRIRDDVAALLKLTAFDLPLLRVVRPFRVVHIYYGFGDASGKQFGATISANYNGGS
jgi:hypothetical protein